MTRSDKKLFRFSDNVRKLAKYTSLDDEQQGLLRKAITTGNSDCLTGMDSQVVVIPIWNSHPEVRLCVPTINRTGRDCRKSP